MGGCDGSGCRSRNHVVRIRRSGLVLAEHGGLLKRLLLPFRLGVGGRLGSGRPVHELDRDRRRTARHPARRRKRLRRRRREPHRAEPGREPRVHPSAARHTVHRPTLLPTPMFGLKAVYGAELVASCSAVSRVSAGSCNRAARVSRIPNSTLRWTTSCATRSRATLGQHRRRRQPRRHGRAALRRRASGGRPSRVSTTGRPGRMARRVGPPGSWTSKSCPAGSPTGSRPG